MENNWKNYLCLVCCSLFLVACHKSDPVEPVDRTVLVYMAADNNLSSDGYNNLEQMLAGMENTSGRLVIYFDPANGVPRLLTIKGGKGCVLDTLMFYSEENSVSAEVFQRVVDDTKRLFPAQSYGLIFWSHGMGWLPEAWNFPGGISLERPGRIPLPTKYFGIDETPENGKRSAYWEIPDIARALSDEFEYILFDACFMSSIEVLYELRHKAHYFIASPAEVLAEGFPYKKIVPLLWGGEEDLKQLCATFYNYYNTYPDPSELGWQSATVALVDAHELESLMLSVYDVIKDKKAFSGLNVWRYPLSRGGLPNVFFDLQEYVNSIATPEQQSAFAAQLARTVKYKAATPKFFGTPIPSDKYSGISTYIPLDQWSAMNSFYYTFSWPQAVYSLQ